MKVFKSFCAVAFMLAAFAAHGQKGSYFKDGRLFIINSSHQDIACPHKLDRRGACPCPTNYLG